MSQKQFMHFWRKCCQKNLRTSSGKFLRVKFWQPESFDFLCLCLTGFDCCRATGLPDSVSTSTQKTRTLERRYAPEQGIWHMICTPCLLAIVWIEIHALYYRQAFGYLTAISEFLAGWESALWFSHHTNLASTTRCRPHFGLEDTSHCHKSLAYRLSTWHCFSMLDQIPGELKELTKICS